tara:strand:+ start:2121 stop:2882 length:762 start_codon:yes stop_codon:yes gene_type:complete
MSNFHSKQKGTQVHNPKRFEEASDNSLLGKIDGNVSYITTNHTDTTTITPLADLNGSLNNKYFYIYTSNNTRKVLVCFNVGGQGSLNLLEGYDAKVSVNVNTNDNVATIIDNMVTALTTANTSTHRLFTSLTDNTTSLSLVNEANSQAFDVDSGFTIASTVVQNAVDEYLVSEATTGNLVFKSAADGIGDKHYVHTQSEASATWTVIHNLSKHPSITVVDSAGTQVIGQVDYVSNSRCTLTFVGAFSGIAYAN